MILSIYSLATALASSSLSICVPEACAVVSLPPHLPPIIVETAVTHSLAFKPFATSTCINKQQLNS